MASGGKGARGSQTGSPKKDPLTIKDVQEQRQRERQEKAAQLIERVCRGSRVRHGLRRLKLLEDAVFQSPLDADSALAHLTALSAAASGAAADASGPSVQAANRSTSIGSYITHTQLGQCMEVASFDDEPLSEQTALFHALDILRLLRTEVLTKRDMERICRHHKVRHQNMISTVILRLILIRHGDSSQAGLSIGASTEAWDERHLLPAGVKQVSGTANALLEFIRTTADWMPSLVLTAKGKHCSESADTICRVLRRYVDEVAADRASFEGAEDQPPGAEGGLEPLYIHELDAPRPIQIARAVGVAVADLDSSGMKHEESIAPLEGTVRHDYSIDELSETPPVPPTVLIVASSFTLEGLMTCLLAGSTGQEVALKNNLLTGRFAGGDIVVLQSPPMSSLRTDANAWIYASLGEAGPEEAQAGEAPSPRTSEPVGFRTSGELWDEAMRRGRWKPVSVFRASKFMDVQEDAVSEKDNSGETTREWRRIVGDPLVLSDWDHQQMCQRAGNKNWPMEAYATAAIFPLVKDTEV